MFVPAYHEADIAAAAFVAHEPLAFTRRARDLRRKYALHSIRLDAAGIMVGRSIFADLNEGSPGGLKVDNIGRPRKSEEDRAECRGRTRSTVRKSGRYGSCTVTGQTVGMSVSAAAPFSRGAVRMSI